VRADQVGAKGVAHRLALGLGALHDHAGEQQTGEPVGPGLGVACGARRADDLVGDEVGLADQRPVRKPSRDHPLVGGVPLLHADPSAVVATQLLDVLTVPDLSTGVAGVGHDRPDGLQAPAVAATVPVATGVGRGRTRHAAFVQVPGEAATGNR
jgi:hypothetical protein